MSPDTARPLVLLVEDEALARLTLSSLLEEGGFKVLPVVSAEEAWEVLSAVPGIQAVVTDVSLSAGGMTGFELARKVSAEKGIGVVVLSGQAAPNQGELPSGVHFVAKPVHQATLVHLVRQVLGGDVSSCQPYSEPELVSGSRDDQGLTPRQHEVLALLMQGKSNRDIAEEMGLSENTVKVHLAAIFRTLGVSSRTEALLAGIERLQAK